MAPPIMEGIIITTGLFSNQTKGPWLLHWRQQGPVLEKVLLNGEDARLPMEENESTRQTHGDDNPFPNSIDLCVLQELKDIWHRLWQNVWLCKWELSHWAE
jgi:hypothetical protein